MTNHNISQYGVDVIKGFEGFSATVYPDSAGKPTIGWGHLLKPGDHYEYVAESTAEVMLRSDLRDAEMAVNDLVDVPLTQHQFDALVCFTFNLGRGALQNSTLLKKLNAGDYEEAACEFAFHDNAGGKKVKGLERRRRAEYEIFLTKE